MNPTRGILCYHPCPSAYLHTSFWRSKELHLALNLHWPSQWAHDIAPKIFYLALASLLLGPFKRVFSLLTPQTFPSSYRTLSPSLPRGCPTSLHLKVSLDFCLSSFFPFTCFWIPSISSNTLFPLTSLFFCLRSLIISSLGPFSGFKHLPPWNDFPLLLPCP